MSKKDKYKLLSLPIAAVAGIFSCTLSSTLLTGGPKLAIFTLIFLALLAALAIGTMLIKRLNHCLWQWNKYWFYQCIEYDEYHIFA
ncbi:MAG: hypothetical protein GY805_05870 [Chloroflexi bacterium]|nr:hypothetical protein [Chloroflexota bacterium]